MKTTTAFWDRVEKTEGGCWLWTGARVSGGYGCVRHNGATRAAHRVAWELTHSVIPAGLCVLHKCDVRGCVNPEHLFLGSYRDNAHDAIRKGRFKGVTPGAHGPQDGANNGNARLSQADVDTIRDAYGARLASQAALAARFGVSQSMISRIVRKANWRAA